MVALAAVARGSSKGVADYAPLDIVLGVLICLAGAAFLTDFAGVGTRSRARRGKGQPAPTPEVQKRQDQLLLWRHWLTIGLGAALVVFGLVHI